MKKYSMNGLSERAIKCLPEILSEAGYAGKYEIHPEWRTIIITTTSEKLRKIFLEAESKAQGEPGRMIKIRKTSYSQIWIPATEADTSVQAFKAAISHVENGWPVDNDPMIEVSSIEDDSYWNKDDVNAYLERG